MGLFAYNLKRYGIRNPGGGEQWTRATLGSAFTNTTQSAYELVAGLGLTLEPGVYDMRGVFIVSNSSGTNATAYEIAINHTLNPEAVYFGSQIENGASFNYSASDENANNDPVLFGVTGVADGQTQRAYWYSSVVVHATTAQTVKLATYGAGALCTLDAGSFVEYIRRDA